MNTTATVAAIVVTTVVTAEEGLSLLVDELEEEDGEEGACEGHGRIQVDSLPGLEAVIEEVGHANSKRGGGVKNCTIGCDCADLTVENGSGAHIGCSQDEAVNDLVRGEKLLFVTVGARHEEEHVEEGAQEFLAEGPQDEIVQVYQLVQIEVEEINQEGAGVSSESLCNHVCESEGPWHLVVILSEDVGKSDGGVEVGATDFPEENIEDPEA